MNPDQTAIAGGDEEEITVSTEWGLACPKCKEDQDLYIDVTIAVSLSVSGTDDSGSSHEWDDDNAICCTACGCSGTVGEFRTGQAQARQARRG